MVEPLKYLDSIIKSAVNHKYEEPARYSFRGSSLPYCPVREVLALCKEASGRLPKRLLTVKEQYTMDQGTLIHETIQDILGIQGAIYGHWFCKKCRKSQHWLVGPASCCGKMCSYEEVRVSHPQTGFTGTVDSLIMLPDGKMILADFKTSTKSNIKALKELSEAYRLQVTSYHYVLTRPPYSLPIVAAAIVYLARDDVFFTRVVPVEVGPDSVAEFERFGELKLAADRAMVEGGVEKLPGYCKSRGDSPYCPFDSICFSPCREELIKKEYDLAIGAVT